MEFSFCLSLPYPMPEPRFPFPAIAGKTRDTKASLTSSLMQDYLGAEHPIAVHLPLSTG
jgi:hypothetical protein